MKTLALANHKGGVGKTTVTFHLSGALRDMGLKGLVLDMDDQANLTRTLVPLSDLAKIEATARDVLLKDDQPLPIIRTLMEGIDLCPSRLDFLPIDRVAQDPDAQYRLAEALRPHQGTYDFCLIDCPPSVGIATRAAIVAANSVLVVLAPDEFSTIGIHAITELVSQIRKRANPTAEIAGYLLNRVDPRRRNDRELENALSSTEEIKGKFLKSRLSQSIRYVESMADRTPITSDGDGKYSQEIRSLCAELFTFTRKARKTNVRH